EMFPLVNDDAPNPTELFQIWLNLPAASKFVDPHFTMQWDENVPKVTSLDDAGRRSTVTVIAGRWDDAVPGSPPPHSWASRPEADVAIWHLALDDGARLVLPPASSPTTVRTLYVFEGDGVSIGGTQIGRAAC